MAVPLLIPKSTISSVTLPATGTTGNVVATLPYGIYTTDSNFISGASDQVAYTYKMLGGDVLDIELTEGNVYASYEISCLEYSYWLNLHQAKSSLPSLLGNITGSFDQDGELKSGLLSSSLSGSRVELILPAFDIGYAKQVSLKASEESSVGGNLRVYSASIGIVKDQQEYDLQGIIQSGSNEGNVPWTGQIRNRQINVTKVYYKTPRSVWRFYGYYGSGFNVAGDLSSYGSYGQYADNTTFEVIPTWEHKLQSLAYADSIYTRISHYSYDLRNNRLRLYPTPNGNISNFWFEFVIPKDNMFDDQRGTNAGSSR